jgi:hypothetical protein
MMVPALTLQRLDQAVFGGLADVIHMRGKVLFVADEGNSKPAAIVCFARFSLTSIDSLTQCTDETGRYDEYAMNSPHRQ